VVAHSILIIAYTMLKTNRPYQKLGGTYLEQINKDQLQRYYVKRLQRLGLTVTVQPAVIFEGAGGGRGPRLSHYPERRVLDCHPKLVLTRQKSFHAQLVS
jgi:hypothetical protein